jgi:holo-[acyl-carrier protein] synthase
MTPHAAGLDTVADQKSSLRVGIDLVNVSDVVASVERFGDQYVGRIFTPHEVEYCRADRRPTAPPTDTAPADAVPTDTVPTDTVRTHTPYSYESMAARFAAKEAVVKVLRPVGARPDWRDIEVYRSGEGWTEIRLYGKAAVLAAEAGIDEMAVSLTHEGSSAAAVVIGVCHPEDRSAVQDTTIDRGEV